MHLYLVGCEYTGKTTLSGQIMKWAEQHFGRSKHFHDHFTVPPRSSRPWPSSWKSLSRSQRMRTGNGWPQRKRPDDGESIEVD